MSNPKFYYHTRDIKPAELQLIIDILNQGGIGVLPTDTIYGLVGSALNQDTVEKIYKLRKRTPTKPMIILISSIDDIKLFNIPLDKWEEEFLNKHWPNPLSIILPCPDPKFAYLHRGTNTLAFRLPKSAFLQDLLIKTGPLVVPSANFEGEKPAETIEEANNYFDSLIDFCLDAGRIVAKPSTLVKLDNNKIEVIREGQYKLD